MCCDWNPSTHNSIRNPRGCPMFSEQIFPQSRRKVSLDVLRQRLFRLLFLKYFLLLTGLWLFLWGIGVLVFRVLHWVSWEQLWWGGLGLIFVPVLANLLARVKLPEQRTLCATLDRENSAGGLVVSSLETDLGEWNAAVPNLSVPAIRWNGRNTYATASLSVFWLSNLLQLIISSENQKFPNSFILSMLQLI